MDIILERAILWYELFRVENYDCITKDIFLDLASWIVSVCSQCVDRTVLGFEGLSHKIVESNPE